MRDPTQTTTPARSSQLSTTTRTRSSRDAIERELLRRLLAGDRRAEREFFEHYLVKFERFFIRELNTSPSAEDLVQSTLCAVHQALPRYRGEGSPRSFVYGIARNHLNQHLRKVYREAKVFTSAASRSPIDLHGRSITSEINNRRQCAELLERMAELSSDDQLLLKLRYWEELTSAELGRVFDAKSDTIRGRLRSARRRLERALEGRDPTTVVASTDAEGPDTDADERKSVLVQDLLGLGRAIVV